MRFFAIAAALLSFTGVIASPAPLDSTDLAARAEGDLEGRTFWKCSLLDKLKCKKKGDRYSFNDKTCHCEEVGCPYEKKHACLSKGEYAVFNDHECTCSCASHGPSDCAKKGARFSWNHKTCQCKEVGCPSEKKHACLSKGEYAVFNDHECTCSCASHGPSDCAKKGKRFEWQSHSCVCKEVGCSKTDEYKCHKAHGEWNAHECTCKYPDPCASKRSECAKFGWGCNDKCECVAPEHEKCKSWLKALICYKLGKKCDSSCKCY